MSELPLVVQHGLGRALVLGLPLLGAGLAGSVLAGWLGARVGLGDPVAGAVVRGLAVLGVLVLMSEMLGMQALELASETWSQLAVVGREP
ncbi:MAG: hypothetical protein H6712_23315 [Myxococcales bacterium]|nr:hypothetical protein [Myxococcales bacterium]MCB9716807.1 hypothetical protein [Myxococcales bacterium]